MAKADGLKHGRPLATVARLCDCECTRFEHCPANDNSPCKAAYKAQLKDMRAKLDKQEAKS